MSEEKKVETKKVEFTKEDIDKNKGMAIIAYIIFFIPFLTEAKDSPFVKFHLKQAIMLVIAWVILLVVGMVPVIGWILAPLASLALFVLWIIGILHAVNGEAKEVPVIGKYAEQYLKF